MNVTVTSTTSQDTITVDALTIPASSTVMTNSTTTTSGHMTTRPTLAIKLSYTEDVPTATHHKETSSRINHSVLEPVSQTEVIKWTQLLDIERTHLISPDCRLSKRL